MILLLLFFSLPNITSVWDLLTLHDRHPVLLFIGAQIKSLYSTKYINTMISSSDLMYITTKDIATHIGHHLSNKHCSVYVYISFEKELVILLLPSSKTPTSMEVSVNLLNTRKLLFASISFVSFASDLLYYLITTLIIWINNYTDFMVVDWLLQSRRSAN